MELTGYLILVAIVTILYWLLKHTRKPPRFPPGPPRLPLVGGVPFLPKVNTKDSVTKHQMYKEKFGKVYGVFMSSQPVIYFADFEVMKEVFKLEAASGRVKSKFVNSARPGGKERTDGWGFGIIPSIGTEWAEQRRFALRNLRDFGFGKSSMEEMVREEVNRLANVFRKTDGKPTSLHLTVNVSVINALWNILVGETFEDLEDPKLRRVVDHVEQLLTQNSPVTFLSFLLPYSFLTWPGLKEYTRLQARWDLMGSVADLIRPYIEEHVKTFNPDETRDFVDVYIKQVKECNEPESSFYKEKGMVSLLNVLLDMFLAGSDTTSASVVWGMLYMIHHPDIQTKVQDELDHVFGRSSMPSLVNGTKEKLPYTNAVISECFRKTSLAHMGVPHYSIDEMHFKDFSIPKNCLLVQNLYSIHHDPEYWETPDVFNPGHFLDKEGKYCHRDRLQPFGIGKRYCLGQTLAEQEFFLFFTGLLHQFRVENPKGKTLPSYGLGVAKTGNIARACPPYEVCMRNRGIDHIINKAYTTISGTGETEAIMMTLL